MTIPSGSILASALVSGVLLGGLFAVTALGLSLVFGVMRLVNLAHGELVVLGAYLALELSRHAGLDPLLAIPAAAAALFILAVPVHRVLLEPLMARGQEPALITTFALSVIAQNLFIVIWSGDTQTLQASYATGSVAVAGIRVPVTYLISFGIALALAAAVHLLLRRTGFGRQIRASSEDEEAAAALGVNVARVHALVFGLAAACAAIGGVLVGVTFDFTPTTGITYLISGFAVVVLGGLGSVQGTVYGAVLLGVAESVGAAFVGDGYRDFIGFAAFLVVLSLRPQGLFGRVLPR
jgi:branched-chain amino acid transport system permease protein